MHIRDRIKDFRRVHARELVPNPRNWRTHRGEQRDALRGVLAEVGYADALLARELPDGRLLLIDGHLRAETTPDQLVPVLVLDVNEAEADKILATLDPLGAMGEADFEKLNALCSTIEFESAPLSALLEGVLHDARSNNEFDNTGSAATIPKMELIPYEHYDYVLVLARTTHQWEQLCELLGIVTVDASIVPTRTMKKIGLGRCISADELIRKLRVSGNSSCDSQPPTCVQSVPDRIGSSNGDPVRRRERDG